MTIAMPTVSLIYPQDLSGMLIEGCQVHMEDFWCLSFLLPSCSILRLLILSLLSSDQPHTSDLHLSFLLPVVAGHISVKKDDGKVSAKVSTIHVALSQEGEERAAGCASRVPPLFCKGSLIYLDKACCLPSHVRLMWLSTRKAMS